MTSRQERTGSEIAVVGIAGRFPGTHTLEQFWENLRAGVEAISFFTPEELEAEGLPSSLVRQPNFVPALGRIDGIDLFDAHFFGFTAREAELMDPQQRLFLETAWAAIERAGYNPDRFPGKVGVYAGTSMNTYNLFNLTPTPEEVFSGRGTALGNEKDFLATRVSYLFNLRGPGVTIQSACSTSLVAVHFACQGLLNGECDMALAGGSSVLVPSKQGYLYKEGSIYAPDGHCRAFDAEAHGTVSGTGVGAVVLKRLEDALADGDHIHAVILGSAINNDGSGKVGYTAPSVDGQADVIAEAMAMAGVKPDEIGYIEAHGTGTQLGDPIEIEALTRAFRAHTDRKRFCGIGSVKTNIGHLDTAAGVAGLIKAVLTVERGEMVPSINFTKPNPMIDFDNSPFFVNTQLRPWGGTEPRRAGVSSFGVGGTNAHVVIEQPPAPEPSGRSREWQLLPLSARTAPALEEATANLVAHLEAHPDLNMADVAFTLHAGRRSFEVRRMLVCRDREDALTALRTLDPKRIFTMARPTAENPVVFLFPGQGAQYVGMARELYEREPFFRQQVDALAEPLRSQTGLDLRTLLFPAADCAAEAAARINQTEVVQPALFVIEYALARQLMKWGIRPQAMIGHSLGEYVAACLAGVFTPAEALSLVAQRGRLMQALPAGAMLAVPLPEAQVAPLLEGTLSLAAVNGPSQCVVSGPDEAVEALSRKLAAMGVEARRLHTSHAFHSAMMDPILDQFAAAVRQVKLNPPKLPYISNVTGTWITQEQATDPAYWVSHLRGTVRFGDGVRELLSDKERVFLEVGPGQVLSTLARAQSTAHQMIPTLRHPQDEQSDVAFLLGAVGRLWLAGVPVDGRVLYAGEKRRRLPLPTYPFQRKSYWVNRRRWQGGAAEAPAEAAQEVAAALAPASVYDRPDLLTPYVAPRTDLEREIAAIWGGLLGLANVGIHDNFFDLGGHSLLAGQIVARLREQFGVELSMRIPFDSPTVAEMAAVIEPLMSNGVSAIPRRPEGAPAPLSFSQRRLWFLEQMQPGTSVHHLYLSHWLEGQLDLGALEAAFTEIVRRHEVLRTAFANVDGEPVQIIAEPELVPVPVTDLTHLPEASRESEAIRLAGEDLRRPMDLARGPLFRPTLYRVSGERHLLLVTVHHLVWDGWCEGLLMQELSALYGAFTAGKPGSLPALPVQYGDYALWQQTWMEQEEMQRQLGYWKQQLAGKLPVLQLPTDRPRPALQTYRGGGYPLRLPTHLLDRLNALCRQEGTTLFMTLMAAWTTLLHRYSGQEDILVGTPIAGRTRKELENLAGYFINNLVLRNNLAGDPSFRELLARVREVALGAFANQDVPFEKLVEELQPERRLSHSPLFQVMFIMESYGEAHISLPGLTVQPARVETRSAQFDLMLYMQERSNGLLGFVEYNADLFDEATVARMMEHFGTLLEAAAANPEARIGSLPLLTEAERRRILVEWNDTRAEYPLDRCLHEQVQAWADRTPGAVAVAYEGQSLTYGELNGRANQLARHLRRLGVGPDSLVGFSVERSPDMLVGLLGILKAGGAYVPLDPNYPPDRLAYMLQDSGARVLLTQAHLRQSLPAAHQAQVVCLDADWPAIALESPAPPESLAGPENLAYVIYTSGSTGRPKGVMISHRALNNMLTWTVRHHRYTPADAMLAVTSISFDIAGAELYPPLLSGGRVVLAGPGTATNGARLAALMREHGVTCMQGTPATYRLLLGAGWESQPGLTMIVGGEPLPRDLADRLMAGGGTLWDEYGPTETTIWSTYWQVAPEGPILIGRPMANTQCYVLDRRLEPVPTGVPGELYIGGDGLARGYLNRPELTAERFVTSPYGRIYKTGDLARFLPDGQIEYLGRLDNQVKIRGYRIELGEIEAVLEQHPGIAQAVVVARDDGSGESGLVAYYVPAPGAAPTVIELRAHLKESLPDYMIPALYMAVDAMPLTPSGKVDRPALPAPDGLRPELGAEYLPPATDLERQIAAVWQEVLRVDKVGVNDNFFQLGGHSLLLMKVLAKLQEQIKPDLTIVDLFDNPTVASLAKFLGDSRAGTDSLQEARGRAERQKQAQLRQKQLAERRRTDG